VLQPWYALMDDKALRTLEAWETRSPSRSQRRVPCFPDQPGGQDSGSPQLRTKDEGPDWGRLK
jgi:hypothetical protein